MISGRFRTFPRHFRHFRTIANILEDFRMISATFPIFSAGFHTFPTHFRGVWGCGEYPHTRTQFMFGPGRPIKKPPHTVGFRKTDRIASSAD